MKNNIFSLLVFILLSCSTNESINQLRPLNTKVTDLTNTIDIVEDIPILKEIRTEVKTIHVPKKAGEESYSINNLITDCKIIPLETTDKCLIGEITKLCSDKNLFVVFDKRNQSVFRFSSKGHFLGNIGGKGRGPKEFTELCDVSLDKKRKEICLLDLGGRKIMYYNYSGVFLREESMYYYTQIEFSEDKMILNTGIAQNEMAPVLDYSRLVVSSKGNQRPLYKGFTFPGNQRNNFNWAKPAPLQTCKNQVFYSHVLSDTLWQIKNNYCIARYVLDFPERNALFTKNEQDNMTSELYSSKIKNNRYFVNNILMTKDFLLADIGDKEQSIPLIYCVSSGNVKYNKLIITHSSDESLTSFLHTGVFHFTFNDTQLVTVVQPFDVYKNKKYYEGVPLPKQTVDFINKINKEDNPILLISTLRKF